MSYKESLVENYIELSKKFLGENFKPTVKAYNKKYLMDNFKIVDLIDKINAVEKAISDTNKRLNIEKYYTTEEGKAYKKEIENKIEDVKMSYVKSINDTQNWISENLNELLGENKWGVELYCSCLTANITIGLLNPENKKDFLFGHTISMFFDAYNFGFKKPKFELNYSSMGSFDLFENETRPTFLNGLSVISNNKVFLQTLYAKLIELTNYIFKLQEEKNNLKKKLENPNI